MRSPWASLTPKQRRRFAWASVIAGVSLLFGFIVGGAIYVSKYKAPIPALYGAGTSLSAKVMSHMLSDYAQHLKKERNLRLVPLYDYDSSRAVTGGWDDLRNSFTSFAGVETNNLNVLSPPDSRNEFVSMPIFRSALALGHHVPECANSTLAISIENLARIFSGSITTWNNPLLVADAVCLANVAQPISALYRTTPSSATYLFTRILHSVSSGTLFPREPSMTWPYPQPNEDPIPGNDFMLFRIRISEYSIGYLPWSTQDPYFSIYYAAIKYQENSISMSSSSIKQSEIFLKDNADAEAIPFCTTCWPLLATSYIAMRRQAIQTSAASLAATNPSACINLAEAALFVRWALGNVPPLTEYASISPALRKETENTLQTLQCNDDSLVETNFRSRFRLIHTRLAVIIGLAVISLLVSAGLLIMGYNEHLYDRDLKMLAAVVGDDKSALEEHLLQEIYASPSLSGISLDDYELSVPDDSDDERAYRKRESTDNFSSLPPASSSPEPSSSYVPPSSIALSSKLPSAAPSVLSLIPIAEIAIGKLIGSGSFGDVFKGQYNRKTVAVKRISIAHQPEMAQSFVNECRSLALLNHPNILSLIGIAIQTPYTFILTEYCKFGSLDRYLVKHPGQVSFMTRIYWMTQVAEGMAYLHSQKVIHRDLKLNNILLDANRQVKIADLGTAVTTQLQKDRTRGVGSIDHTAPECLDGKPYDESCDVYSFAICCWCLFSGMPLYPGYTMFDIISRVLNGQRPSLDFITSKKLGALIEACWNQDPKKRPNFANLSSSFAQLDDSDFQSFA